MLKSAKQNKNNCLLSILEATKASGHDNILKETVLSITPAVTKVINISIILGELPDK